MENLLAEHSKFEESFPDRSAFVSRAFVPPRTAFRRYRQAKVKLPAMGDPKRVRHETVTLENPFLDVEVTDGSCMSGAGLPRAHERLSRLTQSPGITASPIKALMPIIA